MDYGKSGNPKSGKVTTRGPEFGKKGAPASVKPPREDKAALLARMKAATKKP
jgi:hypothetical protein